MKVKGKWMHRARVSCLDGDGFKITRHYENGQLTALVVQGREFTAEESCTILEVPLVGYR